MTTDQLKGIPRMWVAGLLLAITLGFSSAASAQNFGIRSTNPTAITAENCAPANNKIDPGETVSVRFAFTNNTGRTVVNLVVTLQSSSFVLSPSPAQAVGNVANGQEVEVIFSFLAGGNCEQTFQPTLQFNEGTTSLGILTYPPFLLGDIVISTPSASNGSAITINDNGPASPYPSQIAVSSVSGVVQGVKVRINGLTHTFPADLDVMVVGPKGQRVMLLSDAGSSIDIANVDLTFDDNAPGPPSETGQLLSGTYRPVDYDTTGDTDTFPNGVAGPGGTALSVFNGQNPNGTWSLFISDDNFEDSGSISGGWSLEFTTQEIVCCPTTSLPTITGITSPQSTQEDTAITLGFTVNDDTTPPPNLIVTFSSSRQSLVPDSGIQLFSAPNGTDRSITLTPAPNANGTGSSVSSPGNGTVITLTVRDQDGLTSAPLRFLLNVQAVNDSPTITDIPSQSLVINTPSQEIPFIVGDIETAAGSLTVVASSSNETLVPNSSDNIQLGGQGSANRTIKIVPAQDQTGQTVITVTVVDGGGLTASDQFLVFVSQAGDAPTISDLPNQTVNEDAPPFTVNFLISDFQTPADQLNVAVSSSNPGLAVLTLGGSGSDRTLTIAPNTNQFGVATIRVTVTDTASPPNSDFAEFTLTVNAVNDFPFLRFLSPTEIVRAATVNEDTAYVASITADDAETGPDALVFSTTSTNATLVSADNVIVSGAGTTKTLTVIPNANRSGQSEIVIRATDQGGAFAEIILRLTVTAVNDPPTFTKGPDQTVNEDSGTREVANWATNLDPGPNETSQSIASFNVQTDRPNFFTELTITPTGSTATLSFTPAADAFGVATVTARAVDSGGAESAPQSFFITIVGINDAPTFVILDNMVDTVEDAGAPDMRRITVNDFVSSINPGGTGGFESGQGLTFLVTLANAAQSTLFSEQPTITRQTDDTTKANLTFTPAPNAFGNDIEVRVRLRDDGGTANGGVDTSAQQLFFITIAPVADVPFTDFLTRTGGRVTSFKSTMANPTTSDIVTFTVGDPDLSAAQVGDPSILTITIDPLGTNSMGAATDIYASDQLGVNGANRALIITPKNDAVGEEIIRLTLHDTVNGDEIIIHFAFEAINVNRPPTLLGVPDTIFTTTQTRDEDSGTIAFNLTVSDVETAAADIVVTASSDNQNVIPNSGLFIIHNGGGNRTLLVNPGQDKNGNANVIVRAEDKDPDGAGPLTARFVERTIRITITPVPDAPIISLFLIGDPPKTSTPEDTPHSVGFAIDDPDSALSSLTVSASSTNQTLVPNTDANLTITGTGGNRTLLITPALNQTGLTEITLTVTDPDGLSRSIRFQLTVTPINDPPTVTGLNLSPSTAEDTPITLDFTIGDVETPVGVFLNNAGTFNLHSVGASTNEVLVRFRVDSSTERGRIDSMRLNNDEAFRGANRQIIIVPKLNQSGTVQFSLLVRDRAFIDPQLGVTVDSVTTTVNFTLTINAVNDTPVISAIADQEIEENTSTGPLAFAISDVETAAGSLQLTPSSDNTTLVPPGNITFGGTAGNRTVTVTPAANASGIANITITVTDGAVPPASASTTFKVTVVGVDDPPTISPISALSTAEDTDTALINFTIADDNTPANSLVVRGTSSNTNLVPNQNIFFGGSGANRALIITPAPDQNGTTVITVTVSDATGHTASRTFTLTVTPVNDRPTISDIPDQRTTTGQEISNIPFTVDDAEIRLGETQQLLDVRATSSNQSLIPDSNILLAGTGFNRSIRIVPASNQNGSALITVTVTDAGGLTATDTFTVTVSSPVIVPDDFNGDGNADIVFQDNGGNIAVWFMDGATLLSSTLFNPGNVGDANWRIVGTGDFNRDNDTDLLFQHTDGSLSAWYMDGINLLTPVLLNPNHPGQTEWRVVGTADFNRDGNTDILFQHSADGTMSVWYMNGINLLTPILVNPSHPGDPGWRLVGAADFNRDGNADLAYQHANGLLAVWFMNGVNLAGQTFVSPNHAGDVNWRVRGLTDLHGDGNTDLLFQRNGDNVMAVWHLNGVNLVTGELLNPPNAGGTWQIVAPR